MNKILKTLFGALSISALTLSSAYSGMGVSLMYGQVDTDGTETERTVSGVTSETTSASRSEKYIGGSIFYETDYRGFNVGIDVVPLKIELGDGKRTDTTSDSNESTDDSGTYSASADVQDLITLYTNIPIGSNGLYGLLGYHTADVTTTETLPNSTYGDTSIDGYQVGLGLKSGNLKYELSYSECFMKR